MKKVIIFLTVFLIALTGYSQDNPSSWFDFWIGEWDLTWDSNDGNTGKGTNKIIKILDGKVIQENFVATEGSIKGFKGTSISVYNPNSKSWHQAWADSQGGYFNFIGERDGDNKIFKTIPKKQEEKEIILRMVFYDITDNSLTWDWERSEDGGKTWSLRWRINYKRKM